MFFEIVSPSNAQQLAARMSEPQKIQIRLLQNEAQMDSYRHEFLMADGPPSMETMKELHANLMAEFTANANSISSRF